MIAGKEVGPVGLGCMSLTNPSKPIPQEQAIAVLKAALDNGANFWNTGLFYGTPDYNNLHLLNAYFTQYPEDATKVVMSVKAYFDFGTLSTLNDPENVSKEIERCLAIADGKFFIDIFEPARLDADLPVEVTIEAIAKYVRAGKIGGIGLSECSAASIRKAVAVHPIASVEVAVVS